MALSDHLSKTLVFQKILSAGSLRKAAKELHLSQPALSRTLAILEHELRCALVVRTREGLRPTPQGQELLAYCRKLQELTAQLEEQLGEQGLEHEVRLQLGTYESIAVYFFPFFLKHLRQRQKKLHLNLRTASSAWLMEELRMSRLDLIVSVNPKAHRSVISETLFEDCFSFYGSPSLEKNDELVLIGMKEAHAGDGQSVGDFVASTRLAQAEFIDCASIETVKALSLAGLGVGILPTRVAEPALRQRLLQSVALPRVPAEFGPHTVALSYLKSRQSDPALIWLSREMRSYLATR